MLFALYQPDDFDGTHGGPEHQRVKLVTRDATHGGSATGDGHKDQGESQVPLILKPQSANTMNRPQNKENIHERVGAFPSFPCNGMTRTAEPSWLLSKPRPKRKRRRDQSGNLGLFLLRLILNPCRYATRWTHQPPNAKKRTQPCQRRCRPHRRKGPWCHR